jgi:hypothetical protein
VHTSDEEISLEQVRETAKSYTSFRDLLKPSGIRLKCFQSCRPGPHAFTTGVQLDDCLRGIDTFRNHVGAELCIYKIGITSNPIIRFRNYQEEGFTIMWVIHYTLDAASAGVVEMLEAGLISHHINVRSNRNVRKGGDGNLSAQSPPYCTYIVGGRADVGCWHRK